jgi:molybdopterin converting factor small subunit
MAKILIPAPLRQYAGNSKEVDVNAPTAGAALQRLTEAYPALGNHLFTAEGKLRAFVNIYVNDDDIRYLDREATAVGPADLISIVPSIAGGAI